MTVKTDREYLLTLDPNDLISRIIRLEGHLDSMTNWFELKNIENKTIETKIELEQIQSCLRHLNDRFEYYFTK